MTPTKEHMKNSGGRRFRARKVLGLAGAACALSLALAAPARAAPSWPEAAYSYYANNESLQDTLRDFAGGFSLSLRLGPHVAGVVNGKFNADSPTEFMDRLSGVYGLSWFVHAGTLFVSRASDLATRAISARGSSIGELRQALQQLGVLDSRFGWGELPDQNLALVSGPPDYVDLIDRTVAALPMAGGGQQVAVFRLKHASVNDRSISYRDQKVMTPGLATVLRNLIRGSGGRAGNEILSAIAAPLRENPASFGEDSGNAGMESARERGQGTLSVRSASIAGTRLREPTIQADTRLNAIIVQDIPERLPIYRELIKQLDVPSTLVEIEAMIVDVNSDLVNELGVTWGAAAGTSTFGYGDSSLHGSSGLPLNGVPLSPGTIGLTIGNTLAARLRALQKDGQANILSQPSILTADNLGAMIDLSDTFYIRTVGERVANVTPITVGTSLRVTPRYIESKDGARVELTVDIEDGRIQEELQADQLPRVRKSNISTLAIVGNDQTLLIGGYNHSRDSQQTDKVPFLGDIPVLGALFSSKSKTTLRQERLFLIRPRIVAINGAPVPPLQAYGSWGPALGVTWGSAFSSDGRLAAGPILQLAAGQDTRVLPDASSKAEPADIGPALRLESAPMAGGAS